MSPEQIINIVFDVIIFVCAPLFIGLLKDMSEVKTNMNWVMGGLKILGDKAGVILHSPHTPEFDALIEKFWHASLTQPEAQELCGYLSAVIHETVDNPITPGKPYTQGQKSTAIQMLAAVSIICRVASGASGEDGCSTKTNNENQ